MHEKLGSEAIRKMELTIDQQAKGTRILTGQLARERRTLINTMISIAEEYGFEEIVLPSVEKAQVYTDKAGPEILSQMYTFPDKAGRELCLRPEGTATVQLLADKHWKQQEKKLWYDLRCWRYERNQMGRYREFTQFGIEWINPKHEDPTAVLLEMAERMANLCGKPYGVNVGVKRGLSYYTGTGFEVVIPSLGAQRQVVGAGPYKQGIGFAVGIDRLLLAKMMPSEEKLDEPNESEKRSKELFLDGKWGKVNIPTEESINSVAHDLLQEFIERETDYYDEAEQRAFLHGCREAMRSNIPVGRWSVDGWREKQGGRHGYATAIAYKGDQVGSFLSYETAQMVANLLNMHSMSLKSAVREEVVKLLDDDGNYIKSPDDLFSPLNEREKRWREYLETLNPEDRNRVMEIHALTNDHHNFVLNKKDYQRMVDGREPKEPEDLDMDE